LVFNLEVNNIFQPNNEYFKLNVIPVVNLYRTSSEPIRYDHKKSEYKIAVDDGCEVYRLLKVTALNPANGEEFEIRPFLENMCISSKEPFYSSSIQQGLEETMHCLSLSNVEFSKKLHISCELLVTNGDFSREQISDGKRGFINNLNESEFYVTALVRPTRQINMPDIKNFYWRLLANIKSLQTTSISLNWLKNILTLYDFSRTKSNQEQVEGLKEIHIQNKVKIIHGSILNIMCVNILLNEKNYSSLDKLYWFCHGVKELLKFYVPLNSFLEIKFIWSPSYHEFGWFFDGTLHDRIIESD
ncbi:MAG: type VI secretion system baseplate subunit TssF, partial [Gammaproteobacteria bacterium]